MAATIKLNGVEATVTDGAWKCSDPVVLAELEATRPLYMGGEVADVDLHLALIAERDLGAELIRYDEPENDPGVIY